RVFPGDPRGSYSEQMTHACINEFVIHGDAYVDLHGGDIPEALVPFVICRAGNDEVAKKSKGIAMAFGLPYVLTVGKPVQPAKGLSSYAAAADKGISSASSGSWRSWTNATRRGRIPFSWSDECDTSFRDD